MKCSELQYDVALYADGSLGGSRQAAIEAHLQICPLCRQAASDHLEIRSQLRQFSRPEVSNLLKNKINEAVRAEFRNGRHPWPPVSNDVRYWFQMRVMPYSVGVIASLLIGMTFLTMMFSGMLAPQVRQTSARRGDSSIMIAGNNGPYSHMATTDVISPIDFARNRMAYSTDSPSVNPQGALVALTRSFIRGDMKDEEVVVVADVFSNGLARITEVVEPSKDRLAVAELEKALQSDPEYAPFVPSDIDERPEIVRVVLKFQSVDVKMSPKRVRTRL